MIPDDYKCNNSRGEKLIFNFLKKDLKCSDWYVLHSLPIDKVKEKKETEIDFVVIIPEKGILCIEVKDASKIYRNQGSWYYGEDPKPKESPFEQIKLSREALRDYVLRKDKTLSTVPIFSLVIFSGSDFTESGIDFDRENYLNRSELFSEDISKSILNFVDFKRDDFYLKYDWFKKNDRRPSKYDSQRIVKLLRGDFTHQSTPNFRRSIIDDELVQSTSKQTKIIEQMREHAKVLIEGAAGTGKTYIAMHKCKEIAKNKSKVLFVCYNKPLADWLNHELSDFKDYVDIFTIHAFMSKCAGRSQYYKVVDQTSDGSNYEREPTYVEKQKFFDEILPNEACESLKEPIYDYLIVDEAQDILIQPNIEYVLHYALKGTLRNGNWLILGDFINQSIYDNISSVSNIKIDDLTKTLNVYKTCLYDNCRNIPKVVEHMRLLAKLSKNTYQSVLRTNDGGFVKYISYEDDLSLINTLNKTLIEQKKIYPPEEIVILYPHIRHDSLFSFFVLRDFQYHKIIFSNDSNFFVNPNSIRCTTIRKFKGLEAKSIILVGLNQFKGLDAQKLFYIGASRSTHSLTIIFDSIAKKELQELIDG